MNPATMRRLATGIGLLSLVAALVLTVMLINKAQSPTTAAPAAAQVSVVVANAPVHMKDALSSYSGKFHLVTKPKDQVPEDALQKLEDLDGKYALANIEPDTIVEKKHIGFKTQINELAAFLQPGYDAITVPADRLSILNGALKPDDFVDILVSADIAGKTVSRMVLKNIRVLQVGGENLQSKPAAPTGTPAAAVEPPASTFVTLQVRPDQLPRLTLAVSKGHIQLVLRGVGMIGSDVPVPEVTGDELFGKPAGEKTAKAPSSRGSRPVVRTARNTFSGYSGGLPPAGPVVVHDNGSGSMPPRHGVLNVPGSAERHILIIRGNEQQTVSFPNP